MRAPQAREQCSMQCMSIQWPQLLNPRGPLLLHNESFALVASTGSVQVSREGRKDGTERLHLELQAARPPWGTFNVTGSLQGWSFADSIQKSDKQVSHLKRLSRYVVLVPVILGQLPACQEKMQILFSPGPKRDLLELVQAIALLQAIDVF